MVGFESLKIWLDQTIHSEPVSGSDGASPEETVWPCGRDWNETLGAGLVRVMFLKNNVKSVMLLRRRWGGPRKERDQLEAEGEGSVAVCGTWVRVLFLPLQGPKEGDPERRGGYPGGSGGGAQREERITSQFSKFRIF